MTSCTLCQPWTAYQSLRLGLISEAVPALRVDGQFVPNPTVVTDQWIDGGRIVFGEPRRGEALAAGKALMEKGTRDLSQLDAAVEKMVTSLLMTMPSCTSKTIESIRKHKLAHWDKNRETNRAWLALNMMTEANAGFRAFNEGTRESREVDFVLLRQKLAEGATWGPDLIASVLPAARARKT